MGPRHLVLGQRMDLNALLVGGLGMTVAALTLSSLLGAGACIRAQGEKAYAAA